MSYYRDRSHLQRRPAELIPGIRMHPAFLQDPLHFAGIPFGCRRRQRFASVHLTEDHYKLRSCLFNSTRAPYTMKINHSWAIKTHKCTRKTEKARKIAVGYT